MGPKIVQAMMYERSMETKEEEKRREEEAV